MTSITYENTQFVISILTLAGITFAGYKFFRDPDVKAKYEIKQIKNTCEMKHDRVDNAIKRNADDLKFIKDNHIAHIELDVNEIKITQTRILTILEERNYGKNSQKL